jgi:hypothetical protein
MPPGAIGDRREEPRPVLPAPDPRPRPYATREGTPASRPLAAVEPTGPATAREACGGRVFIALAICMDRDCEQPRYRSSGECVRVLEVKRARENR